MKKLIGKAVLGSLATGLAASVALTATAAAPKSVVATDALKGKTPVDIAAALSALRGAEVLDVASDGLPTFLRGDLGRVDAIAGKDAAATDSALRAQLVPALAAFRLAPSDLKLLKVNVDEAGNKHVKYRQTYRGVDVVGGDLIVHLDSKGTINAINGNARGGVSSLAGGKDIGEAAALSFAGAEPNLVGLKSGPARLVYFVSPEGQLFKAYESEFTGTRGQDPVRDKVFIGAATGNVVGVHPQIHHVLNRRVHSSNNGTTLPGTLRRSEGQAATTDTDVNAAYDNTGATYNAYRAFWNRDSYNNAGATLTSSVHYSNNYCNAFWNGTQMVFGDGNSAQGCLPLARSVDVTGHELTHAVTENESGLIYSGQSGGLNEAYSDIFGAFVESYVDGGSNGSLPISSGTWAVGEDILPPGLRFMNDPARDGASLDYYTSTSGNVDVHLSSGIANLAFYLLSQGGTHPRGRTTVNVTGVGLATAIRIFYQAQVNILTPSSTFLQAGNATVLAAQQFGYSTAIQTSVANAWQAVNVAVPTPGSGGGGTGDVALTNGVTVTGISGATGSQRFYTITVPAGRTTLSVVTSGGTGDLDLYVRRGARPTTATYDCRPFRTGNAETCTFNAPVAGTYYILLNGYAAYSGASLRATY